MTQIVRTTRHQLTAAEMLTIVDDGGRVIVETTLAGTPIDLVVRKQGDIYYCDTATTLRRHDTREEARRCLEEYGLAKPVSEAAPETPSAES